MSDSLEGADNYDLGEKENELKQINEMRVRTLETII